ncbi:MAG: phosphopentomutase [Oscillospiraceae bacterium]|nr:phosphopentomutase [Oscillospiraceae bacterium]
MKRLFLIVLDSCGIGALPDAEKFGDTGANTLKSCYNTGLLDIPNMLKMGLGNIEGLGFLPCESEPTAAQCRLAEISAGKDTTIGHWEIAGLISDKPLPTYPNGFPQEVIDEFEKQTGRGVLCNKPYSGTEVIKDYGEAHIKSGDLIVYTSADSVFQIASHEEVVPIEQLYEYCRIARKILVDEHAVGRVIARPFVGDNGSYTRTSNRHDFSLEPYGETMLDVLKSSGKDVIAIGKITDIFAGRGVTETVLTSGNTDGMAKTLEIASRDFNGLCFTNLVDFDSQYGHRNNALGYTEALNEFDAWLGEFLKTLRDDDVIMITADHGCDPGDISTDHTREYVPLLVYGRSVMPTNLGTRATFADIAATVCDLFKVKFDTKGISFKNRILSGE